jgi:nucleoside-triphosphatase THEP1
MIEKTTIYIITGEQGGGKTTFAKHLINILLDHGIPCGGFYAEGYWENDRRSGFDLHEAGGTLSECLCNTVEEAGDVNFKRFFFKKAGLEFGKGLLLAASGSEKVVFIDEVGMMEAGGRGWYGALAHLLENPPPAMVWVVRDVFMADVLKAFNIRPQAVWNTATLSPDAAAKELILHLEK